MPTTRQKAKRNLEDRAISDRILDVAQPSTSADATVTNLNTAVDQLAKGPDYISTGLIGQLQRGVKTLFDTLRTNEDLFLRKNIEKTMLKELLLDHMDVEQIWQQIDEYNVMRLPSSQRYLDNAVPNPSVWKTETENLASAEQDHSVIGSGSDVDQSGIDDDEESDVSADALREVRTPSESDFDEEFALESELTQNEPKSHRQTQPSEIDDRFFKLSDMDDFLEAEERRFGKQRRDTDDGIVFTDADFEGLSDNERLGSEEGEEADVGVRYDDFFDPPPSDNENVHNEGEDEERATQNGGPLSTHEKQKKRLKEKIVRFEEENLAEKTWIMAGEVTASTRPENSLLEEHLQVDHVARPTPEITQDVTQKLEQLIRQRIKDKAYDDVQRKEKPKAEPHRYKTELVLDQQKSKQSLNEIYEQEYVKQQQKETEEKENPAHVNIRTTMDKLFRKLDALTHYHFTPREPVPEVVVVNNMPSIGLEEAAPLTTADAALLAPHELKAKRSGVLKASSERDAVDRKRERRLKKKLQHERAVRAEKRQKTTAEAASAAASTDNPAMTKVGRPAKKMRR